MIDLIAIGERVKAERVARGWTQTTLKEKCDVSRARIEALENGRAVEFGVVTLGRILTALGLDIRLVDANNRRPTLDDLTQEADDAPRMGR